MNFAFVGMLMKASWRTVDDDFEGAEEGMSDARAEISGSSISALLGDACEWAGFSEISADVVGGTTVACDVLAWGVSEHTWPLRSRAVKECILPTRWSTTLDISIICGSGLVMSLPFCHPRNATHDAKINMVSGRWRETASTCEGYSPNAKWWMALPAPGRFLSRVLPPSFPRVRTRRSPVSRSIPNSALPFNSNIILISCAWRTRLSSPSNSG